MKKLYAVILTLIVFLLLVLRINLSIVRFFDPDEFAHFHWAYLIFRGQVPYRDFFTNIIPVFQLIFQPLFMIPPSGFVLILGRIGMFMVHLFLGWIIYELSFTITKNRLAAIFSVIVWSAFPMIFDKSLELRPDTLMTALFFAAVYLIVTTVRRSGMRVFLAGMILGTSLLVMVKMAVGLPAFFYLVLFTGYRLTKRQLLMFILAFVIPPVVFLLWVAKESLWIPVVEYVVRGSQLIKAGEGAFSPWKSLSPYPYVYYGTDGPSFPWLVNIGLWITGVTGGIWMLVKNPQLSLFFLLLVTGSIFGFFIFPTPFMQYFIPICAAFSILTAYLADGISKMIPLKSFKSWPMILFSILLTISFLLQYSERVRSNNREQLDVIADIVKISRPHERVYDMVGSYVFRPDGYFICCNEYAKFAHLLTPKLPSLARALSDSQTRYIILDRIGKSLWLPAAPDLEYINGNFRPSLYPKIYTLGWKFKCQNGVCARLDMNGREFPAGSNLVFIPAKDSYIFYLDNNPGFIFIDNRSFRNGDRISLDRGPVKFTVSEEVTEFIIQLNR